MAKDLTPLAARLPSTPLSITIRFTTSIPDLLLDLPLPSKTTVISLKALIRSKLSPPTSTHRLRLIHGGKILPDAALLPSVIKIPPPPPRELPDPKGKGKAVDIDPPARVYINCSIGDPLTVEELAAEAAAAAAAPALSSKPSKSGASENGEAGSASSHTPTTTPTPRGFDRLLSTGFTPAEVGQLRLQFLSIQASTHTPDTIPSPSTLRRMEDAWIDDNGATTAGGNEGDADMAGGAIDDLLWGHVIGFLWPLGALIMLFRDQGIWSGRRQTAVYSGVMLCLAFGFMNLMA
ncbi:MAG: hypothetical protein M1818_005139 [Claussenomyces sp. TS43310]|nr:MAG: hypothetical protein M1818_005139 [Claussenomyces sp. TS43310]